MEKKKINRNEKHTKYVQLLNSKEWRELRAWKIQQCRGLCERCRQEGIEKGILPYGYITPAKTVHHINPVEGVPDDPADTLLERMKARCFDKNNLMLLCPDCHHKIHEEMKSHQGQMLKTMPKEEQKEDDRMKAWAARQGDRNYQPPQKPRKGIRKTYFGWMTTEEYKQKKEEQFEKWKQKQQGYDTTGTQGTPTVDAPAED